MMLVLILALIHFTMTTQCGAGFRLAHCYCALRVSEKKHCTKIWPSR